MALEPVENTMSKYGLETRIDLDGAVSHLPANIYINLRNQLDTNPNDKDWRALIRAVENEYKIKPALVEIWSPSISSGSPSDRLFMELSSMGMTVRQLKQYLCEIGIDTYLLGLSPYEDIVITKIPPLFVELQEGGHLILEVNATGLPFPRYQWYFCKDGEDEFKPLQGRTERILQLIDITITNAGSYSCQIHNCKDPKKTKLTDNTLVSIKSCDRLPPDIGIGMNSSVKLGEFSPIKTGKSLIMRHPADVVVARNGSFTLHVETCGDPPISYQWIRNEYRLPGKVSPKLIVTCASTEDFGYYYCIVNNGLKTESSHIAHVKECIPLPVTAPDILLISQPKSVTVKFGGSALFTCEARCVESLKYQWFKDGKPLPAETNWEIKFVNIQDRRVEGLYQCEISVDKANCTTRIFTTGAYLKVEVPAVPADNVGVFNPSDKVALLIGNYDYKSENPLKAPTTDVTVLSETFRALSFKVVSLLNLTKPEIENAVLEFCHLVDKNVYAVFYFCGHGFEEQGLSFLVPTDAPAAYTPDECVCSDSVLEHLQRKDPALVFMILDICRQPGKVRSIVLLDKYKAQTIKGNTVTCYATSVGLAAYENKTSGLLVYHLAPLLHKQVGIDDTVKELKEAFYRMPRHCNIQIPELKSNLLESGRSLTDLISHRNQTEAWNRRTKIWIDSIETPKTQRITFANVADVDLDFQAQFANILDIYTTVVNCALGYDNCEAFIRNFSPSVSQLGNVTTYKRKDNKTVAKISLQDIQKLQSNLIVEVTIKFMKQGQRFNQTQRVDLGLPLVSKLMLWKQHENFTMNSREAIEQAEDTDSL